MAELDALAIGRKDDDVLAGDGAAAQRSEADRAFLPSMRLPEAVEAGQVRQQLAATPCRSLAEEQRRSRRRVV